MAERTRGQTSDESYPFRVHFRRECRICLVLLMPRPERRSDSRGRSPFPLRVTAQDQRGPSVRCPLVRPETSNGVGIVKPILSATTTVPLGLQIAAVYELETEPPLDAQVAVGDLDIQRRGDLHDPVVLNVERERAAHAAIGADRVGLRLPRFVPLARPAAARTRCGTSGRRSGRRRCSCRNRRTRNRAAEHCLRSRSGRRSPGRRRRSRRCSGRRCRTPRRTCSRGCTSRSREHTGRCRSSPAGRRSPRRSRRAGDDGPARGRRAPPAGDGGRRRPVALGAGAVSRRVLLGLGSRGEVHG